MHDDQHQGEYLVGAEIISAVRAYDALTSGDGGESAAAPYDALRKLRKEGSPHDEEVVGALAWVLRESDTAKSLELAHA